MTKIRKVFKWAHRGKHWTSKQTISANSMSVLAFRTTHTMCFLLLFCCPANSKAPKVEQVFPCATCNNHSFVVLFVDWSIMKLMLQFGKVTINCRGRCVVLSTVHKVFGWPKFLQPSEWTNFPHATHMFGSMKWWQNHFDVITISIIWRQIIERWRKSGRKEWL